MSDREEVIGLNDAADRDARLASSKKLNERRDILRRQSSSTKQINTEEDGGGCKPLKRTRSVELHNRNEMIRRQNVKDKMKTLRKMIPNCNQRDNSSTLDDVANYIKVLQNQIQIMSTGQHGIIRIPYTVLQTAPPRVGMEFDMGMGAFSMFNLAMNQLASHPATIPASSSGSHSITQEDARPLQSAPRKDRR